METTDQVIAIHRKAMENQKKALIDKACNWVKENFECYVGADVSPYYIYVDEFVEDFRKAITEEE